MNMITQPHVEVVRGATSREKTIRLVGIEPGEAAARLGYS